MKNGKSVQKNLNSINTIVWIRSPNMQDVFEMEQLVTFLSQFFHKNFGINNF